MTDTIRTDVRQRLDHHRTQGMHRVRGWFDDDAAEVMATLLAAQVERGVVGDIAEIGVYQGKSFLLLANGGCADERAVSLDVFAIDYTSATAPDVFTAVRMFSVDGGHSADVTAHDLTLAEACLVDADRRARGRSELGLARRGHGAVAVPARRHRAGALRLRAQQVPPREVGRGRVLEHLHRHLRAQLAAAADRERQLAELRTREVALSNQVTTLQARVTRLEADVRRSRDRVKVLQATHSWRVTAPLRAVAKRARRR